MFLLARLLRRCAARRYLGSSIAVDRGVACVLHLAPENDPGIPTTVFLSRSPTTDSEEVSSTYDSYIALRSKPPMQIRTVPRQSSRSTKATQDRVLNLPAEPPYTTPTAGASVNWEPVDQSGVREVEGRRAQLTAHFRGPTLDLHQPPSRKHQPRQAKH